MPPTPKSQICAGCHQEIIGRQISCSAATCKKIYDITCSNGNKLSQTEIAVWICPECRAHRRKTVDSSTPIRSTTYDSSDNITLRKKSIKNQDLDQSSSTPVDISQALYNEFKAMRQGFEEFKPEVYSRLDSINLALQEYGKRMEVIETKQDVLERRQGDLDSKQVILENRNQELEMMVKTLEHRLASMNQQNLRNEVEVIGVQEKKGEQPAQVALAIASKVGMSLNPSDIDDASRAGPLRSSYDKNVTRPLVVRFANKCSRDIFLKEARARRTLTSKDIVEGSQEQRVFVNERLTPENRQLFRAARERAAACDFKYCWVKNGCIYMRKKDGSPALRIASQNDIRGLAGPAPVSQN